MKAFRTLISLPLAICVGVMHVIDAAILSIAVGALAIADSISGRPLWNSLLGDTINSLRWPPHSDG